MADPACISVPHCLAVALAVPPGPIVRATSVITSPCSSNPKCEGFFMSTVTASPTAPPASTFGPKPQSCMPELHAIERYKWSRNSVRLP
jgi:hypothetical protein